MPVFISHRTADKELATQIYNRLKFHHRIDCWLDSVNATSNPATITQQILKGINDCTHLLAVITRNTDGSWWVPYEVGVAEQGDRAITTFSQYPRLHLPEYLWHWPVLSTDDAIDRFAAIYKQEKLLVENVRGEGRVKAANQNFSYGSSSATAQTFHSALKRSLGQ